MNQFIPALSPAAWARLDAAARRADAVAEEFGHSGAVARCRLLERISFHLESVRQAVAEAAAVELGQCPSEADLEHQAALDQLRAFCTVLRDGPWHGAAIDTTPPQQRMRNIAVGPVAVLGAGCRTPIYAAAGVEVIAALAAGCPVIAHRHASHPRCCDLLGQALARAVREASLPDGVYGLADECEGSADALLTHPGIKAAIFGGDREEGLRLARRGLERCDPIPVFIDMPSANPVFVLPDALNARAEYLGKQLVRQISCCAARGAFKTGIVVAIDGDGYIDLRESIIDGVSALPPLTMPDPCARHRHADSVERLLGDRHVDLLAEGAGAAGRREVRAMFAEVDAARLLASPALAEERPGPAGLLVRCADASGMLAVAARLERQQVAGLHTADGDTALAARLMPRLERMARHVDVNSFTVMPVYRDAAAAQAMARFLRPVFYQDVPPGLPSAATRVQAN